MRRRYNVLLTPGEEAGDGGYTVTVPSLAGCITEGDSADEALANAREALALFVESLQERGIAVPPSDAGIDHLSLEPGQLIAAIEVAVPATPSARAS